MNENENENYHDQLAELMILYRTSVPAGDHLNNMAAARDNNWKFHVKSIVLLVNTSVALQLILSNMSKIIQRFCLYLLKSTKVS